MNRRPWFGITGRREAQVLRRGGERVYARLAPVLNCQNRPGLYSKVNDDLVSSENGVTTVEKLRKYKYNPFLVYFTNLMITQST